MKNINQLKKQYSKEIEDFREEIFNLSNSDTSNAINTIFDIIGGLEAFILSKEAIKYHDLEGEVWTVNEHEVGVRTLSIITELREGIEKWKKNSNKNTMN